MELQAMMVRGLIFISRLVFAAFLLLSATYCLLAYLPFTYQQIIIAAPLAWLIAFARFHPWIYWLALAIVAPTVVPDLRLAGTRWLAAGFLGFTGLLGIWLVIFPVLSRLANTVAALYWGLLFLTPLVWLAIIDWVGHGRKLVWHKPAGNEGDRVFRAAWQSALFLSVVYAAIAYYSHAGATRLAARQQMLGATWSMVCHLLLFMGLFAAILVVRLATRRSENPARLEFFFFTVSGCTFLTLLVRFLIFPLLSFQNAWANVFSAAIGVAFGAAWASLCSRLFASDREIDSGLGLLLRPLSWRRLLPGAMGFAIFAVIAVAAWFLTVRSSALDWNFLRQKLSALFIWTVTFANFYDLAPRSAGVPASMLRRAVLAVIVIAPLGAYGVLRTSQLHSSVTIAGNPVRVDQVLDRYAGYDPSFKLLFDGLVPFESSPYFYRFLKANTNIDVSAPSASVNLKLVDSLVPNRGPKPNIFIFVIDSLRRDYLGVYNPAVTFTPNFDAFARDSVTFTNGFTRYGGTGLSEPSIWSGAMLLHKQYPKPFYPMNSLEKLIEADGYSSYIGWDPILQETVRPSDSITALDSTMGERTFDFCKTMDSLEDELSVPRSGEQPVFVYAQSQNIHTWVVNEKEGASVPPGESYPGFYEPVAARVHYMDQCWGKFDKFMKQSGRYDNTIVVLTSDHGEMLGEEGRWGHGYAMVEDVSRIPLIVHLPPALRSSLYVDPESPAFLTDITPSLYYILGHRPILRNELFGKPLFTQTREEAAEYDKPWYLLVSSYTPVYAILKGDARTLFVANAADEREFLFDLSPGSKAVEKTLSPELSSHYESLIQSDVRQIARFYSFNASP